jgi:pilus assembly protein Flp/PilA
MFKTFLKDESGASMVEYGLLVGLIAIVALSAVEQLGNEVKEVFETSANALDDAVGA